MTVLPPSPGQPLTRRALRDQERAAATPAATVAAVPSTTPVAGSAAATTPVVALAAATTPATPAVPATALAAFPSRRELRRAAVTVPATPAADAAPTGPAPAAEAVPFPTRRALRAQREGSRATPLTEPAPTRRATTHLSATAAGRSATTDSLALAASGVPTTSPSTSISTSTSNIPAAAPSGALATRAVARRAASASPRATTAPAPASGAPITSTTGAGAPAGPTGPAASGARPKPARLRAVVALSFAALLAAGTSLSAAGPADSFASTPSPAAVADPQTLITASVPSAEVVRDIFQGTTPEELAAARAAERAAAAAERAAAIGFRTASTFANNSESAIQWPFPVGVPISDGFGPRSSPGGIGSTNHKGVDFTPGQGKPISAVASGVVSTVQRSDSGGLGVYVVVEHEVNGESFSSWYGHMLTGSPTVAVGDAVLVGQQLGSVGNTGTSTGAHLHLEIHVDGAAVDPYAWLTAHN